MEAWTKYYLITRFRSTCNQHIVPIISAKHPIVKGSTLCLFSNPHVGCLLGACTPTALSVSLDQIDRFIQLETFQHILIQRYELTVFSFAKRHQVWEGSWLTFGFEIYSPSKFKQRLEGPESPIFALLEYYLCLTILTRSPIGIYWPRRSVQEGSGVVGQTT